MTAIVALTALTLTPVQAQSLSAVHATRQSTADNNGVSSEEQAFWRQVGIDSGTPVQYLDQNRKPISFAQANTLIGAGHAFSVDLQNEKTVVLMKGPRNRMALRLQPGDAFPAFSLPLLNGNVNENGKGDGNGNPKGKMRGKGPGQTVTLHSLLGRPTLLNFYFAECGPCVREAPRLARFFQQHKELNLLAITFDSPAEVKKFVRERQFNWPVAANADALLKQIGVPAYPAFVLLDAAGKVVATDFPPRLNWEPEELEAWVAQVHK